MAAQVLSGTSSNPLSYTNNTGENVRLIVYYLETTSSGNPSVTVGAMGAVSIPKSSRIGKYVASHNDQGSYGNNHANEGGYNTRFAFPCEFVLANSESISGTGVTKYNILIIPEGG